MTACCPVETAAGAVCQACVALQSHSRGEISEDHFQAGGPDLVDTYGAVPSSAIHRADSPVALSVSLERRSSSQAAWASSSQRARTCKLWTTAQRRRSKRFLRTPQ